MEFDAGRYDVAVIGAGHAGIEAGLACARMGLKTVVFTINLDAVGNMLPLFFYAAAMVGGSFVTMLFVRHGDSKPEKRQSKIEAFADND